MMRFIKASRRRLFLAALLALATAGSPPLGAADVFEIPWWTVDGGSAQILAGGPFELSATVGQPDAGTLAGGPFVLYGGFWSITDLRSQAAHWQLYR